MSVASWDALPRASGVDQRMRVDPVKNHVPGHEDPEAHLKSVLEFIGERADRRALIEIAAVGDGAEAVIEVLDREWGTWGKRVRCLGVGLGYVRYVARDLKDEGFKDFWGKVSGSFCGCLGFWGEDSC